MYCTWLHVSAVQCMVCTCHSWSDRGNISYATGDVSLSESGACSTGCTVVVYCGSVLHSVVCTQLLGEIHAHPFELQVKICQRREKAIRKYYTVVLLGHI